MIIVIDNFASAAGDGFTIAWHGSVVAPARLVIATRVAVVVLVMSIVCTFAVAVRAWMYSGSIERIRATLCKGVIGALTMHVTGLKPLLALGGTLLVVAALVVALVVVAAITAFAVVDLATSVLVAAVVVVAASSHCKGLLRPAFAGKVFELASVALLELVAHLALRIESNLFDLQTAIMAIIHASVVNRLEILRESL